MNVVDGRVGGQDAWWQGVLSCLPFAIYDLVDGCGRDSGRKAVSAYGRLADAFIGVTAAPTSHRRPPLP